MIRTSSPASTEAAQSTRFDRRLIAPMVLGSMLNPINSSIITVSLIPIGRAFDASPARTAWLVSALYVATAIGQPVVGRLVDVLGPRRLYLAGAVLVGVAGIIGLVAQDLGTLVAARVVLGVGTCAGYPSAMYLIRAEGRRTGQESPSGVLTVLAVSAQTIAVVGPTLGGLLIGVAGWRATFAVNIPIAIACLWLGARRLPEHDALEETRERGRFDLLGTLLFGVALVATMLFLMERRVDLWPLLVVAAGCLALFAYVELRHADPFVDLRLLRATPPLVATYARNMLSATVTYSFIYGFTQWLQESRDLSPAAAGLMSVPMFATAIAVSALTGRNPRIRAKLLVGSAVQLGVCAGLLLVGGATPLWALALLTLALGVPQGLVSLANQNAVYHQAPAARIASSAGLLRTSMYVGAVLAAAATGTFLHAGATTSGLHGLAGCAVVAAALALVLALADRSLGRVGTPTRQES
ncbi:MFS transporter [Nocardioides mangrovi]|uniref:MFS transporter n=1 Tax=Nocardioides mangrovi TaxID=2874580 RepID=A0ABS7U6V5_9ACTN|nr:MFS transporter [Nocardioides mangrovi]MBZ5736684.1 MFS transporter [Nocardioides mangrovi]